MEKEYTNKEMLRQPFEEMYDQLTNDWIGDDFIEQLEWAMLMTRNSNFQSIKAGRHLLPVTRNTFDKAYLMNGSLKGDLKFLANFSGYQADPQMFPNLNIKILGIGEQITLHKIKELPIADKNNLKIRYPYAYDMVTAFYKKDVEDFFCMREGYAVKGKFFDYDYSVADTLREEQAWFDKQFAFGDSIKFRKNYPEAIQHNKGWTLPEDHPDMIKWRDFLKRAHQTLDIYKAVDPIPFSLVSGYMVAADNRDSHSSNETRQKIALAYQIAFTMYYEWGLYLKESNNIGFVIPIDPCILKEMYSTSMMKFDTQKRMLTFVKEHYRRKLAKPGYDYDVFVRKYLRGEHNFEYNGFSASIVPPRYELNRVKTNKKFINAIQD